MNLEAFFEHFNLFADAPNAVARMRELVLHLAVQGKLVPQDPTDEPARELVERISQQKQKMIRAKQIRQGKVSRPAIAFPPPRKFPPGWEWASIDTLCFKVTDGTHFTPQYVDSGVRFVSAKDIAGGRLVFDRCKYITNEEHQQLYRRCNPEYHDILISKSGSIGTVALVEDRGEFSLFESLALLKFDQQSLCPELLVYALTHACASLTAGHIRGVGVKHLHLDILRGLELALPPLAEQRRIVAKVNELMTLCDRLEAQQQEWEARHAALARAALTRFAEAPTPANLNLIFHKSYDIAPADLRKTILTLAVQGKLVPQTSPAKLASLGSILAEASVNGVSKGPTSDTAATEILRISAGTSRNDFYVDEGDFKHVHLPAMEIEKFRLAPGDLLACRFNGNLHYVGRFSYYRGESGRAQVNPDKLIRFRVNNQSHCPRYVCYAMNATPARKAIEAMCATTAGNIGLSAGRLRTVEIPIPPLAEQRRIVAKVDQMMALVDALVTQLTASRTTAANLLDALVAELTARA